MGGSTYSDENKVAAEVVPNLVADPIVALVKKVSEVTSLSEAQVASVLNSLHACGYQYGPIPTDTADVSEKKEV